MDYYPYKFEASVAYHDVGSDKYAYTVVYVTPELIDTLPLKQYPRLRIQGEIDDVPFDASLTPVRGDWYILLSKKLLKALDAGVGDEVTVRFGIADQDAVTIPAALGAALQADDHMRELWDAQTAGKKRGLAHRVATAKAEKTEYKRIQEVFGILRGELDMRGKPLKP